MSKTSALESQSYCLYFSNANLVPDYVSPLLCLRPKQPIMEDDQPITATSFGDTSSVPTFTTACNHRCLSFVKYIALFNDDMIKKEHFVVLS